MLVRLSFCKAHPLREFRDQMALLTPACLDIRNKSYHGGNTRQIINSIYSKEIQIPPVKIALRVRAQLQGQGSVEDGEENRIPAAVKRALEKAKAYKKKQRQQNQNGAPNVPESESVSSKGGAAFDSLEQERAYEKQQGEKGYPKEDNTVEVEIITKGGVIRRNVTPPEQAFSNIKSYKTKGISSIDFIGLEFSEKKSKRGLPAGLNIGLELPSSGPLPEVEIITRDAAKLNVKTPPGNDNSSGLYKPKVATWGIFPRPENISKTYGGGKVIRPGDVVETKEEKEMREAKTKKLLDDYKEKMGLKVDPIVKANCEKVLKEGNELMEIGKVREALVLYEKIMDEMVFQSELHGLAALQWSVCLDSIGRLDEARMMYEKLGSHPNGPIRKKAKHISFSFQAMEMMKFSGRSTQNTRNYENYFQAFSDGYQYNNTYFPTEEGKIEDEVMAQSLPYIIFLLFPIILVFTAAASKGI